MRLDRLLPLPQPVQPSGRREERPARRQPEASDRPSEPPADDQRGPGTGEQGPPPDHLDITV